MLPGLAYETAGPDGAPWVTFVAGIGNDRQFWAAQAGALSGGFRMLRFDPWGHGQSPAPPEPCRFADLVTGVVQLWDELDITSSAVVGLGFGGSIAMALALDNPSRVDRLVACCCRPRQPDDRRDFWRDRIATAADIGIAKLADITVDRWLSEEFRSAHPAADSELRAMFRRTSIAGYQASVGAFIEMDFADRVGQISTPTLLVAGENDHGGGPVEDMAAMADAIPGATLEIVADAGHIINFEAPGAVSALLGSFLAQASE